MRNFRADRGESVRFFGDDQPIRLFHRIDNRVNVERFDRARVNDFDRNVEFFFNCSAACIASGTVIERATIVQSFLRV
jgi:hypothetical protein